MTPLRIFDLAIGLLIIASVSFSGATRTKAILAITILGLGAIALTDRHD